MSKTVVFAARARNGVVVGVAEGGRVDGESEWGDKGAGLGDTVDRDLVIVERGRRRANNMAGESESQRCGHG